MVIGYYNIGLYLRNSSVIGQKGEYQNGCYKALKAL